MGNVNNPQCISAGGFGTQKQNWKSVEIRVGLIKV